MKLTVRATIFTIQSWMVSSYMRQARRVSIKPSCCYLIVWQSTTKMWRSSLFNGAMRVFKIKYFPSLKHFFEDVRTFIRPWLLNLYSNPCRVHMTLPVYCKKCLIYSTARTAWFSRVSTAPIHSGLISRYWNGNRLGMWPLIFFFDPNKICQKNLPAGIQWIKWSRSLR